MDESIEELTKTPKMIESLHEKMLKENPAYAEYVESVRNLPTLPMESGPYLYREETDG